MTVTKETRAIEGVLKGQGRERTCRLRVTRRATYPDECTQPICVSYSRCIIEDIDDFQKLRKMASSIRDEQQASLGNNVSGFSFNSVVDVTKELEKAIDRDIPPAPSLVPGHGNPVGNQLHVAIAEAQVLRAPETSLGPQGDSRFNVQPSGDGAQTEIAAVTYRYQPVEAVQAVATDAGRPLSAGAGFARHFVAYVCRVRPGPRYRAAARRHAAG